MQLDKLSRARCVLGSVQAMLQRQYGHRMVSYATGDMFSSPFSKGGLATITRRASSTEARVAELPRDKWDFLHVTIDGALVLALRFREGEAELIKFVPGHWECWFGVYNIADVEPFPVGQ